MRRDPWTVLGIPVRVDPSWVIIAVLAASALSLHYVPEHLPDVPPPARWLIGSSGAALLFLSVLVHELGHAVVARRHRIPVRRIVLFMFGGVSQIAHDPKRPGVELRVALAGPGVSLVISALAFAAGPLLDARVVDRTAAVMVHYLAMVNLGLALFNLLPGFPLDGGRVLRAVIWRWTGSPRRATRIATQCGVLLGYGLMAAGGWIAVTSGVGGGLWYACLGWFLKDAAASAGLVGRGRPQHRSARATARTERRA